MNASTWITIATLGAMGLGTARSLAAEAGVGLTITRGPSPGAWSLAWQPGGRRFELESAESALGPWSNAPGQPSPASAESGVTTWTEPRSAAALRFYRLRQVEITPTNAPSGPSYDIGSPEWTDLYVDGTLGRDSEEGYDGSTRTRAYRTLLAAWRSLPEGEQRRATRIRLLPGTYRGAYLEDRRGTREHPILIEPADGAGTVTFRPTPEGDSGSLQFLNCSHVYVQDLVIRVEGGDGLHWERCDHVLARRMKVSSRRTEGQDEAVKANQCQHVYLEDSEISDAGDNCVDVVAVQHGHLVRCRLWNAGDWGAYLKGGSAYWRVEGNEIFGCGTGGFTAGQGSGFQFLVAPWLHYEAYDIKVVNNLIRDCEGAGLGVNGGFNILMAHNTLYRVGARSHLVEFVHGRRGCDGGDAAGCQPQVDAGGWGTTGDEEQYIPNRHVHFVNNLVYNPPGFRSEYQHFQFSGPAIPPPGSNVPSPARSDEDLVIRGNLVFNGPADWPVGDEEEGTGCREGGCSAEQIRAANQINTMEPRLRDPAGGDFRPVQGSAAAQQNGVALEDFTWADAPERPPVPPGDPSNAVKRDFTGALRRAGSPPGAFLPAVE